MNLKIISFLPQNYFCALNIFLSGDYLANYFFSSQRVNEASNVDFCGF
jgi:hypothetical protein